MSDTADGFISSTASRGRTMLLAVAVDQGDRPGRLLDDQAGQDAAVVEGDGLGLVLLADEGAGIDQAGQQEVEVAPLGAGQLGADGLPLVEEPMAGGAVLLEDELAPGGVALVAFGQDAADLGDPPDLLGRAGTGHPAPDLLDPADERRVAELDDLEHLRGPQVLGGDLPRLHRVDQAIGPRLAAAEQVEHAVAEGAVQLGIEVQQRVGHLGLLEGPERVEDRHPERGGRLASRPGPAARAGCRACRAARGPRSAPRGRARGPRGRSRAPGPCGTRGGSPAGSRTGRGTCSARGGPRAARGASTSAGGTASRRRPSSPFSIPATRRSISGGPGAASKSRAQASKSSGSPRAASNRATRSSKASRTSGDRCASAEAIRSTTPSRSSRICRSRAHQIRRGMCVSEASSARRISRARIGSASFASQRWQLDASWLRTRLSGSFSARSTRLARRLVLIRCSSPRSRTVHRRTPATAWSSRPRAVESSSPPLTYSAQRSRSASTSSRSAWSDALSAGMTLGSRRSARIRRASAANQSLVLVRRATSSSLGELGEVEGGDLATLAVDDPVDAAVGLVPVVARVEVRGAPVVPIDDVDRGVGPEQQVDRAEPGVAGVDQRPAVPPREGRAEPFELVPVDGVRQQVAADEGVAELVGVGVPFVDDAARGDVPALLLAPVLDGQ